MKPVPEFEIVEPRAAALVESLRAFGYDLGSALADLVDNCVSASARNVWVDFHWDGQSSRISITDDGQGMTEATLRNAMRLGSRHPGEVRDASDLGRFGLGLKTASFSQCRCVTVTTKRNGNQTVTRRWDLDHLAETDKWHVLLAARSGSEGGFERLNGEIVGTCVLWQDLDRVLGASGQPGGKERDLFLSKCEEVENHLGLVFHRLLQRRTAKLRIYINNHAVRPIDPFFINDATQILQEHRLPDGGGGEVLVEPFVMPHESKLPDSEAKAWAGDSRDWAAKQGFYIYRQDRLLVAASWLGFRGWRKDEHHKLARIRISLTNSSDKEWQIDVTKRKATPPEPIRDQLRRIGERTRERAKKVYTYRGSRIASGHQAELKFVWEQLVRHGKPSYRINRDHPLVVGLVQSSARKGNAEAVLRLIEDNIPTLLIAAGGNELPSLDMPPEVSLDAATISAMLLQAWHALRDTGLSHSDAIKSLTGWEPFDAHPALIADLLGNPPFP